MALDTFAEIAGKVKMRCPVASIYLCRDWVNNAFRRFTERRDWSWLVRSGQFIAVASYTTGTVTVTANYTTVTGSGTTFTSAMQGRQFRIGTSTPIYTISRVDSATSLELDAPWGATTASGQSYEIYQAYFTPPDDFHHLISVWDPNYNWQLRRNVHQNEINEVDAQRSNSGNAFWVSARDYTTAHAGTVGSVTQVVGTGSAPSSDTTASYTGVSNAIFTVEVTTGGASGVAVYKWKKDAGTYTTSVTTDTSAAELRDGVYIYWPTATYTVGDVFVIRTTAASNPGLPRYELWPHQKSAYCYPYLYMCEAADLEDTGAVLPRYVPGDILMDMALAECARWPGPAPDQPNPMYDIRLASQFDSRVRDRLNALELHDNEIMEQDAAYQLVSSMPYAVPWGDAHWLQSHDV